MIVVLTQFWASRVSFSGIFGSLLPSHLKKGALLDLVCSLQVDCTGDVGMGQHSQYGFDDFLHFFVGKPLLLPKHLLTNQSVFDVGVVYRSPELDDWKFEGELLWEIEIDDELEPFVGTALWPIDSELPMEQIFLDGGHYSSA